jgi:citrate synthase
MSPFANRQRAEFTLDGTVVRAELPVLRPTIGAPMVDARGLYREAGCLIYDPALGETGICRSSITYVDGDNGILLYRGYPITDLVEQCSYLEVCWLLLNGELPSVAQLQQFTTRHHLSRDG